jgi:hypothetical protein
MVTGKHPGIFKGVIPRHPFQVRRNGFPGSIFRFRVVGYLSANCIGKLEKQNQSEDAARGKFHLSINHELQKAIPGNRIWVAWFMISLNLLKLHSI